MWTLTRPGHNFGGTCFCTSQTGSRHIRSPLDVRKHVPPRRVSDPALQFELSATSVVQRREGVIVNVVRDAPALGDPFGLVE